MKALLTAVSTAVGLIAIVLLVATPRRAPESAAQRADPTRPPTSASADPAPERVDRQEPTAAPRIAIAEASIAAGETTQRFVVAGRVLHALAGGDVDGARVRARAWGPEGEWRELGSTTVAADGSFALDVPWQADGAAHVLRLDHESWVPEQVDLVHARPGGELRCDFSPTAAAHVGFLPEDANTNDAIAASIAVFWRDGEEYVGDGARPDEGGVHRARVRPGSPLRVIAGAEGYEDLDVELDAADPGDVRLVRLGLRRTARLHVEVLRDGRATDASLVAAAAVGSDTRTAAIGGGSQHTWTLGAGRWHVFARDPDGWSAAGWVELAPGGDERLVLQLSAARRVHGVLVDGATGAPIAGATCVLAVELADEPHALVTVESDHDGRFEFEGAPPRSTSLTVLRANAAPWTGWIPASDSSCDLGILSIASLAELVVEIDPPQWDALPRARIDGGPWREPDARGTFSFAAPPGTHVLDIAISRGAFERRLVALDVAGTHVRVPGPRGREVEVAVAGGGALDLWLDHRDAEGRAVRLAVALDAPTVRIATDAAGPIRASLVRDGRVVAVHDAELAATSFARLDLTGATAPLRIAVVDPDGDPVEGARVVFAAEGMHGALDVPIALDAEGAATVDLATSAPPIVTATSGELAVSAKATVAGALRLVLERR